MRIALVGTRGVPARYGGFETCVEEVGKRLVKAGHDVVVYCRRQRGEHGEGALLANYEGMELVHLPAVRTKALETLSHTALSAAHLRTHPVDVAVVFNSANAPFVPLLRSRGIPVATHVDGLEWKRAKWQGIGRAYYRVAESLAVRWSDALIADAEGIADYYRDEFRAQTELIAYGAPIVAARSEQTMRPLGIEPRGYHLVVARFEPENNIDMIVDGYTRSSATRPLVVVGEAPYAEEHTDRIRSLADHRVRFLGGVWNQDVLDQLYANAFTYLHGHSVGGTNPSLLRAIGAAAPTLAYNVSFNREVLGEAGHYFGDADGVRDLIVAAELDADGTADRGLSGRERAATYDWDDVGARYEALLSRLAASGVTTRRASGRPSGRRTGIDVDAFVRPPVASTVPTVPVMPTLRPLPDDSTIGERRSA